MHPSSLNNNLSHSLSSEDCELLLAFETTGSVAALARRIGRDESVASRQLKRISEQAPVLEKLRNQWRLTELGRGLNRWTAESIATQRTLLGQVREIRIGATKTFAVKALARELSAYEKVSPGTRISLVSLDTSVEENLLKGFIDLAFSCGKPNDPLVSHRRVAQEGYIAVAAPAFERSRRIREAADLVSAPHLLYQNSSGSFPFNDVIEADQVVHAVYNDVLCIAEAATAGIGWGILPYYAVSQDLDCGKLVRLPGIALKDETYGVWWLRDRKSLKPWVDAAITWLGRQRLA